MEIVIRRTKHIEVGRKPQMLPRAPKTDKYDTVLYGPYSALPA